MFCNNNSCASGWATFVAGRDLNSFVGVVRQAFVEYHLCFFRLFLPNCVTFIDQSWHRIKEIGANLAGLRWQSGLLNIKKASNGWGLVSVVFSLFVALSCIILSFAFPLNVLDFVGRAVCVFVFFLRFLSACIL